MRKIGNTGKVLQAGMTLLEMAVVVMVAGVLTIAGFRGAEYLTRSNAAQNIANQGQIGYDVLNNYVAQNIDALVNGQPVAGVASPLAPTPAELVALGYPNFSVASTIPGAQWTYSLALLPAGCTASTCNVAVYFGLTAPPTSRDNVADIALVADAAIRSSRPAGWSTNEAPGNILGIGGQFNIANPQGATPGILALYGSYGAGHFANYVRMGDTRPVTLNNTLDVQGNTTIQQGLTVQGDTFLNHGVNVQGSAVATGGVTAAGTVRGATVVATGQVQANTADIAAGIINRGGRVQTHSNDWGILAYGAGGVANAAPMSAVGSVHANDIYLRSRGQWVSQMASGWKGGCYWAGPYNLWNGGSGECSNGYYVKGLHGPYGHADTNIARLLCCTL